METKFTKGEWKVGEGITTIECENDFIATCHHITEQWITEEQAIANAKLIAAAPEMFNALVELLAQVKQFTDGDIGEQDYFRDEISNAKKAIKKATE